jgi:hypothetical protein
LKRLLTAGNALVYQDFDLNPAVLSPPGLGLVRSRRSVFAHRTWRRRQRRVVAQNDTVVETLDVNVSIVLL